jgi:molecular chaperone GrpE
LSSESNSDEIPVNVISDTETELDNVLEESKSLESEDISKLLELEKQKSFEYEKKLKLVLADFQNLTRKTQSDIENGVNSKINEFA